MKIAEVIRRAKEEIQIYRAGMGWRVSMWLPKTKRNYESPIVDFWTARRAAGNSRLRRAYALMGMPETSIRTFGGSWEQEFRAQCRAQSVG